METGRLFIGVKRFSQMCFIQYSVLSISRKAEDSLSKTLSELIKSFTNLLSISANFSMQHSKVRCEVRKFVAKFKSSIRNSQASL